MIRLVVPLTENDVKMAMRRLTTLRTAANKAGNLSEYADLYQSRCVLMSAMEVLSRDPDDLEWRTWLRDVHDMGAKQINLWLEDGEPKAIVVELPDGAPLLATPANWYHPRKKNLGDNLGDSLDDNPGDNLDDSPVPDPARQAFREHWYSFGHSAILQLSLSSMDYLDAGATNLPVGPYFNHNQVYYCLQTAMAHLKMGPHGDISEYLLCLMDIMDALRFLLVHVKQDIYLDSVSMVEGRRIIAAHTAWITYYRVMANVEDQ